MRAATVTKTEMPGGFVQWRAGKDITRPRTGAARQNDRIDPGIFQNRDLRFDQTTIQRSAVWVVAASHIHINVPEAVLRQMGFQRCVMPIANVDPNMRGAFQGCELVGVRTIGEALDAVL